MTGLEMKVYILTRHAICNYGSLLQSYATEQIFHQLGCEAVTLDYQREDERPKNVTKLLLAKSQRWNKNFLTKLIYYLVQYPDHVLMGWRFRKYQNEWLRLSEKMYSTVSEKELEELTADLFCTGSDQVWGEIGTEAYDPVYFWSGLAKGKKKISLAASLGYTELPVELIQFYKKELDSYFAITVREKDTVELLSQITQTSIYQCLDPTILLGRESWENLTVLVKEKDYVLLYQLNANQEMDDYAVRLAKRIGKKLVRVSPELHNLTKQGKFVYLPTPEYFLSLVKNADFMVTDSFHGTAFAIIFNTQFVDVFPNRKSNRNQSLLELTGLMNRVVTDYHDFSAVDRKIDFRLVNGIIEMERKKSMEILKARVLEI